MALHTPIRRCLSLTSTGWWTTLCLPLLLLLCACGTDVKTDAAQERAIRRQIDSLLAEGKQARENNQFERAITLHSEQLRLAKQIGDSTETVIALNQIGTNYRRMGMLDDAARYHYEALLRSMSDKNQDDSVVRKNRVIALNGLGNIYISLGEYHQADSIFHMALDGEQLLKSALGQAINLANIGAVKEELGQIDSAWVYYRYSLSMNRKAKSRLGEALCFSHFARLHELEGDMQQAIIEYQRAVEAMAGSPDDWHKLDATLNLARIYIESGEYDKASQLLGEARATAERIRSLEHRSQVHGLYYKLYERRGNAAAALDHYKRSIDLRDSVTENRYSGQIQSFRVSLERHQQQGKIDQATELYEGERHARRITTTVLIVIILVALSIIGTLWYTLRERNKTQHIMQQMNKSKEDFFANIAIDPAEMKSADSIISQQDRQFIGRFVDVVYSQMGKGKTDVESVAEQMQLSRAQLNRRVLSITGQNTLSYITQIRISKAKRLLRADITTPIGDIANKCGFDDVAYFSRLFKQQTNMTPSQYRKMI